MTASTASNTRSASGGRRLTGRRAIVALAIGASATLGLSACGAGQVTQTSTQVAGVNGSSATSGAISVRDVQLVYPMQQDAREQSNLHISFTVANEDPLKSDTLESITVGGKEFTLADGEFTITPTGSISTPNLPGFDGAAEPPVAATDENGLPSEVTVEPLANAEVGMVGHSVPVTFTFTEAGAITLPTPVTVGNDVPRDEQASVVSVHD